MVRLLLVVTASVACLIFWNSCPKPATQIETNYTAADSGRTITLQPGDVFTVGLVSSPTTAYFWEVIELDEAAVRNVSSEYIPDPGTKDMAGGGGMDIWKFQAIAAGETKLRMEYARKFEPRDPAGQFELALVVSGS